MAGRRLGNLLVKKTVREVEEGGLAGPPHPMSFAPFKQIPGRRVMQTLHPTLGAGDSGGRLLITELGESSPFSGSVFQLVIGFPP